MPLVLTSEKNLHVLEAAIRLGIPNLSPSHASEAIAFGFGYDSQAAFASRNRISDTTRPKPVSFDPSAFVYRLAMFGYERLDANQIHRTIVNAHFDPPVWRRFNVEDQLAQYVWEDECERNDIPYIGIKICRNHAMLEWSLGAAKMTLDRGSFNDRLYRRLRHEIRHLEKPHGFGSSADGSVGQIDRVALATVQQIADAYCIILHNTIANVPLSISSPNGGCDREPLSNVIQGPWTKQPSPGREQ